MNPNRQLEEILSWRLITELWRRFPNRYGLIETHPGGGQYDCLSLVDCRTGLHSILDINRGGGSVHLHHGREPQSWPDWTDRLLRDSNSYLDEIGKAMGLTTPRPLPSSTSTTIAFRFVCEFLTHAVGRLEQWECRNGFCDTSGYGGGIREEYFQWFSKASVEQPQINFTNGRLKPAYLHWFLLKNGEPLFCLNTDGRLFKANGEVHDLAAIYGKYKRVWPMIGEVAIDLLP